MKIIKNICLIMISVSITGFLSGKYYGDYILASSLRGNYSLFTFLFSPSQSFTATFTLLNSSNDYSRLSGYYAYKESGLMDLEFLYERYRDENSDVIKQAIIWITEDYSNKEKLVDFYRKLYNISPERLQRQLEAKIVK